VDSSLLNLFRLFKYEKILAFYFLGLIKSTQGRTHLGLNPSFFRFDTNVNMGLIEDELTENFLSSSSSLKKTEVIAYLGWGGI
jgi:hypothetical protein